MTNKILVPCLILLILVLGIILCVYRVSKAKDDEARLGVFRVIKLRKSKIQKEESSDEKKESGTAGS